MANIRVDVDFIIDDGSEIIFKTPCDCSTVTGLMIYYPGTDGSQVSHEFKFADAHNNDIGNVDGLFTNNAVIKVILDVTHSRAYIQNADTNTYLETKFSFIERDLNDIFSSVSVNFHNAGVHNSIYRGKSLGSSVTSAQWEEIYAGTFKDMYIGDYWTINNVIYRIAAFDYYYNTGDNAVTDHHVTLVPDSSMYTHKMNDSNTTDGAYISSKMYTEGLTQAKTKINSAFDENHILKHRVYLKNAVTSGYESGGSWYDSTVELMSEYHVLGHSISGRYAVNTQVNCQSIDNSKLPLFMFRHDLISSNRSSYWLRDVCNSSMFSYVFGNGLVNRQAASSSAGVRPIFSIY